jgi:hypothetical protein
MELGKGVGTAGIWSAVAYIVTNVESGSSAPMIGLVFALVALVATGAIWSKRR